MQGLAVVLRDPAWQAAGVLVAVVAIGVTVLITLWQRTKKELSYRVRVTPLLSVGNEIRSEMAIHFRHHPVDNVSLVEILVQNTGRLPIEARDFETPLRFTWDPSTRLLVYELAEQVPDDLAPVLDTEPKLANPNERFLPHVLTVAPLLLNAGDSFHLRCMVTGDPEVKLSGRISGLPGVRFEEARTPTRAFVLRLGVLSGTAFGAVPFVLILGIRGGWALQAAVITSALAVCGSAMIFILSKLDRIMTEPGSHSSS